MNQSRELDKFVVRLPHGLRDRIAERAADNGRSMNAEMVRMLESGLAGELLSVEGRELLRALRAEMASDDHDLPPGVVEVTMRGKPGSGKSTLMTVLGRHLQDMLSTYAPTYGMISPKVIFASDQSTSHGIAKACVNHSRVILLRDEA